MKYRFDELIPSIIYLSIVNYHIKEEENCYENINTI